MCRVGSSTRKKRELQNAQLAVPIGMHAFSHAAVLPCGGRLAPARPAIVGPGPRRAGSTRRSQHALRALWLENSAEVDVAAPLDECWSLWEDQEQIPRWMPWIHQVKVLRWHALLS